MKYLTINQYKRVSDGVTLANVNDTSLGFKIVRAEADIDAHIGFDLKRGGFEPHQAMLQGPFDYKTLRIGFTNWPVPVRSVLRYRIQVSNLSTTGAGFFANINQQDAVVNNDESYVEIVPLQAVTYSLSPVILQLGLRPPIVEMDCDLGFFLPILGDTLVNDTGDNQTFYAFHQFWASTYTQGTPTQPFTLPPVPPAVYANGVVQSASNYTINYTEGYVKFNTAFSAPVPTITADYTYQIPDAVTMATIAQTTWLLGQQALAARGMTGLWRSSLGKETFIRPTPERIISPGAINEAISFLCDEARLLLMKYQEIPVA